MPVQSREVLQRQGYPFWVGKDKTFDPNASTCIARFRVCDTMG